jgi:hypothetical protein
MSAFDNVIKLAKQWQPDALPTELKYRDSLVGYLREKLPKEKVEPEYRHLGTTTDIYVKQAGFFGSSEVFVELKRNLLQKAQYDRLVGQIESLEPKKNPIIVVLCGETNPALLTRLRDRYVKPLSGEVIFVPFQIVEKPLRKN